MAELDDIREATQLNAEAIELLAQGVMQMQQEIDGRLDRDFSQVAQLVQILIDDGKAMRKTVQDIDKRCRDAGI